MIGHVSGNLALDVEWLKEIRVVGETATFEYGA